MILKDKNDSKIIQKKRELTEIKNRGKTGAKKVSRLIFFFLTSIFFGVSFFVIFFSGLLSINKIEVIGTEDLDPNRVKEYVQNSLEGKFLNIIPENNFLLVSKKKIGLSLADQFKKIEQIEIKKVFPDSMSIGLKERKSILLWCLQDQCYFMDENGVAYESVNFETEEIENKSLVKLEDLSGKIVQTGEKILDNSSVEYVSGLKRELRNNLEIEISENFKTSSRIAGDFQVETLGKTKIYFSLAEPMKEEIDKLKVFFEKEFKKDDIDKLEYIDLRSESRVYYKLRESENKDEKNSNTEDQASIENKEESKEKKKN